MSFAFSGETGRVGFPHRTERRTPTGPALALPRAAECAHCPLPPLPPRPTHDSVGWRRAPDEALDLALLPVESMLGLGAGDDGRPC